LELEKKKNKKNIWRMTTTMHTRFKFLLPVVAPTGQLHGFAAYKWVIYKIFINISCCVIKVTHFLRLRVCGILVLVQWELQPNQQSKTGWIWAADRRIR
jgi:hypothetical protein